MSCHSACLKDLELEAAIIRDPLTVTADRTVADAIAAMARASSQAVSPGSPSLLVQARSGCGVVIDQDRVIGILTEQTVVYLCAQQLPLDQMTVRQVMAQPVPTLRQSDFTDLRLPINLLKQYGIRHLPLVDDGDRLVGLLTHESLLQALDFSRATQSQDPLLHEGHSLGRDLESLPVAGRSEDLTAKLDPQEMAFYRLVLDSSPAMIFVKDWEGRYLLANQAMADEFNTTIAALLGKTDLELGISPDDAERFIRENQQIIETQQELFLPAEQLAHPTSGLQWLQWHKRPIQLAGHQTAGVLGIGVDITAHKQTEIALTHSEARWQFALEGAGDGVWDWHLQTNEVFFSAGWKTMLGYAEEELGNTLEEWSSRVHPDDLEYCFADLERYFNGGTECYQNEHRVRCKDGSYKWILDRGKTVDFSPTGQPLRMIGTHSDITARKQAELALFDRERQLSTLIQNLPGYCYRVQNNLDYTPVFISSGVTAITGYHPDEYLVERSISCGQEMHPDDVEQVWEAVQQAVHNHCVYECEYRLISKTGELKWVWERGQGIYSENDELLFLEGFVTEITARKQAEEELQRTEIRLREAQRIAQLGNWELNLQTGTLHWSEEIFRIFEQDPQRFEASYESFLETVHPEDRERLEAAYQKHLRDRTPYKLVHRLLMPDGRVKYVQEQCESFFADDGTPLLSQGTVLEITSLKQAELERERAEDALRQVIVGTAATTGEDFFPALVRHIAAALGVRYASVSRATPQGFETLAFFADGSLSPPGLLPYCSVPCCVQALETGECCHPDSLQELYPGNALFTQLQVDSYLGIGLRNAAGEPSGNLCVLHDQPLPNPDWAKTLLQIFAARAGAELDRYQTAQALEKLAAELEQRVQERTAQLREREARYRAVMDHASDAILQADCQGHLVEVNRKAEELLGYSREELSQMTVHQIHPPEVLAAVGAHFNDILANKANYSFETLVLQKDGTPVPVEITGSRLELNGEIIGQGIFRDIRDRKRTENALRESQQFLQTVLDTFPLSVFWKDRDLIYLGCNQNFLHDAGLASIDDLIGKTDYDMPWGSTTAQDFRADDQQVIESGVAKLGIVEPLKKASGEEIWLETNKLPLRNLEGEVVGVLGTYQDVTQRKQAEVEVKNITDRLTLALQAGAYGIWEWDLGSNVNWNRQMYEIFGLQDLDRPVTYDDWRGLVHPDDLSQVEAQVPSVMQGGQDHSCEFRILCPNGETRWVQSIARARRDAQGMPVAMVGINHDITQRKLTEQQLTEHNQQLALYNQELARATRLKDEFLANMSHELRTPLNAILGMTEGLQDGIFGPVTLEQTKALQTVEGSATHLLSLINDILDVAKIESGQIELECTSVSPVTLCSSSLAFIQQQALQKHIQVKTQLAPHLPDLWVDERRIMQVLINLLTNAVKFTPEGGYITLTGSQLLQAESRRQSYLRISVSDTGIGIATENIPRLFQPFVQIDSALNRQYAGTGLGLALVKQIVELHGGQVGVTSELGAGSCFFIDLPWVQSASPRVQGLGEANSDLPQGLSQFMQAVASPLILLAEDNKANVSTISNYLKAKGYRLGVAHNGREAVAQAQAELPDLILMDIQMPEIDGLEAIRQIRQMPRLHTVPIIALTALAMAADRERCLAAGASEYLSKPVKLKQLVQTIQRLLAARES